MIFAFGSNDSARALLAVLAMMADPGLAKDLAAKAAVPFLAVPGIARIGRALFEGEGMSGRSHADNGPTRLDIIDNMFHLIIGQLAKASENNHEVRGLKRLQAGDIISHVRVNRSVLGIDGEENGAFETMMIGQDFGELRQGFFGAVFLVAADQDNVLAFAGTVVAIEDNPPIGRRCSAGIQAAYN